MNPFYISYNSYSHHEKVAVSIENGTFLWGAEKDEETKKKEEEKEKEEKEKKDKEKENKKEERQEVISMSEEESMHKESLLSQNSESEEKEKKPEFIKALNNVNVKIPAGAVTMVVGDIGSGKSSLLYAMLSEMTPDPDAHPSISINGSIAFCSQKPWIMSGTVKENIMFFLPFEEEKFNKVIYYAGLEEDLKILGKGVETEIGEKGVNLSGGQKARISLARALYSDRDIYLLDDVLSAVDVHVGQFLMEKTILGYLRKKTVIIPSHAISFAEQTDNIIVMKKGEIVKNGAFQDIFESEEFQEVYNLEKKKKEEKNEDERDEKVITDLKLQK